MRMISSFRVVSFCILSALWLSACGQPKISGPFPETGDLTLRVLRLTDPDMPALSEDELNFIFRKSEEQIRARTGRTVRLASAGEDSLQSRFDLWEKPFGRLSFAPRLDPGRSLTEEEERVLYERVMVLLRTEKIRPYFRLFGLDPATLHIPQILGNITDHLNRSTELIRAGRNAKNLPLWNESLRNRRSVFAWYTIFGTFDQDSKPADIILTNDLLIFDSLISIPPEAIFSGGAIASYSRLYPGMAIVSTLPFLSTDSWAVAAITGSRDRENNIELLANAISREAGLKLIQMNQDDAGIEPLDRRRLLADYQASRLQFLELEKNK